MLALGWVQGEEERGEGGREETREAEITVVRSIEYVILLTKNEND